jgi:hypothetical protein
MYLMTGELFWQLLFADDFEWIAEGCNLHENLLVTVFFLTLLGLPMAWNKFKGGHEQEWIGFWVSIPLRGVGLSQARARWLVQWIERALMMKSVHVGEFGAVLGRLSYACTALDHYRPFLGPLFAWGAAFSRSSIMKMPDGICLALSFLAERLGNEKGRVLPVGPDPELARHRELFRSDAKAEGEDVCIGGWDCRNGQSTLTASWFSEKITRQGSPWVFAAGESFRAIASLELLATLCCLIAFDLKDHTSGQISCAAGTDNLGNRYVVSKLMTTKFPLVAVLMEVAATLQEKGAHLVLGWLPRLQNEEADRLSNGDFRGFDPRLRIRVDIEAYEGLVLKRMLKAGLELYDEIREAKIAKVRDKLKRTELDREPVQTKRAKLRETDPWQ